MFFNCNAVRDIESYDMILCSLSSCTCCLLGLFHFETLSYDLFFCILVHNWMMNEPLGQCSAVSLGNLTPAAARL